MFAAFENVGHLDCGLALWLVPVVDCQSVVVGVHGNRQTGCQLLAFAWRHRIAKGAEPACKCNAQRSERKPILAFQGAVGNLRLASKPFSDTIRP